MGALDYNARNLLILPNRLPSRAPGRVAYIDFSSIGWDWTERRLVHYLYALGAGRPDGRFVNALTREALEAERGRLFFDTNALEAHLFAFQCLIAERLLRAGVPDSDAPASDPVSANLLERFRDTVRAVAHESAADFSGTEPLRAAVRSAAGL